MATLCFLLLPRDTNEWSLYIVVDNCTGEGSGSIHTQAVQGREWVNTHIHKLYRGGEWVNTHTQAGGEWVNTHIHKLYRGGSGSIHIHKLYRGGEWVNTHTQAVQGRGVGQYTHTH